MIKKNLSVTRFSDGRAQSGHHAGVIPGYVRGLTHDSFILLLVGGILAAKIVSRRS